MKKSIDLIKDTFEVLNEELQRAITGGTGITLTNDQLQKMFDYSAWGGVDQPRSQVFNKFISDIASTDVGGEGIQLLMARLDSTNTKIKLDDNTDHGFMSYSGGTNTLHLGNMRNDYSDKFDYANDLNVITHELYHAIERDVFGRSSNDGPNDEITSELDANIFASMVEKQLDIIKGPSSIFYNMGGKAYAEDSNNPSSFVNAWLNIMESGGNWNIDDYNTLIDYFKQTRYNNYGVPVASGDYNQMKTDHLGDFSNSEIKTFFNMSYKDGHDAIPEYLSIVSYGGRSWTESYLNDPYLQNYVAFQTHADLKTSLPVGSQPNTPNNPNPGDDGTGHYVPGIPALDPGGDIIYFFPQDSGDGSGSHSSGGYYYSEKTGIWYYYTGDQPFSDDGDTWPVDYDDVPNSYRH